MSYPFGELDKDAVFMFKLRSAFIYGEIMKTRSQPYLLIALLVLAAVDSPAQSNCSFTSPSSNVQATTAIYYPVGIGYSNGTSF